LPAGRPPRPKKKTQNAFIEGVPLPPLIDGQSRISRAGVITAPNSDTASAADSDSYKSAVNSEIGYFPLKVNSRISKKARRFHDGLFGRKVP